MPKRVIHTDAAPKAIGTYSQAVRAGPLYTRLIRDENADLLIGPYGSAATLVAAAKPQTRRRSETDLLLEMLRIVRYPKESVPAGAFTSMDSVVGQTTKVFMSAREPVTAIKLSSRGGGLSMLVRPTMRASSLEVNNVSGVSGFVLPGDRVDVLTTVDGRGANEDAIPRTVLQNIEVLAAGQKTEQKDNKPITVQSVTLLVDPDGAETLALALHEGKIHLVLRNPDDQELVKVASLSTREMLDRRVMATRTGGVKRPVASAPSQVAFSRPAPAPKIRLIKGSQTSETPAVNDSTGN